MWPGLADIVVTSNTSPEHQDVGLSAGAADDAALALSKQPALDTLSGPAGVVMPLDGSAADQFVAPADVVLSAECLATSFSVDLASDAVPSENLAVVPSAGLASSLIQSECTDCIWPTVVPSTDATNINCSSSSTFQDVLGFRLCPVRRQSNRKRTVAHASVLTSSPYKTALEVQKNQNHETKSKKGQSVKRRILETQNGHVSKKSRKDAIAVKKNTRKSSVSVVNKIKTKPKTTNDCKKSKSSEGQTRLAPNNVDCPACHFTYGDASDPRIDDDWLECCKCLYSYHERCAEEVGILDDVEFLCGNCVS